MADDRTDPLTDVFNLFAAPLAGTIRSFDQFRKGVDEFLTGVENFNRTMANLNETTERINSLLADVEEPIRAAVPQVTRTVKAADEMMQVVSGPAMAVAPGLNRLADMLSTPAFAQLPSQIDQFSDLLGEVSRRLAPLTQFAESAGGLLGGFRMPGMRIPGQQPAPSAPTTSVSPRTGPSGGDTDVPESPAETPTTGTTSTRKSVTTTTSRSRTKPSAKKGAAGRKKSAAKKGAAGRKKSAAKKSAAGRKKSAGKKGAAGRTRSAAATSGAETPRSTSSTAGTSGTGTSGAGTSPPPSTD